MISPKTPGATLITLDEIHTFIQRARDELIGLYEVGLGTFISDQELQRELSERETAASIMLAFCAEAAGWTRSPSLLPFLASMLGGGGDEGEKAIAFIDREAYRCAKHVFRRWCCAGSVARILEAGPAPIQQLAKL